MGLAFEELIRKFAELSNETAGEHFTPRERLPNIREAERLADPAESRRLRRRQRASRTTKIAARNPFANIMPTASNGIPL